MAFGACIPVLFSQLTVIARGLAALRKYGSNARLWLPGLGYFNGTDLGNYLDSAGTTKATVDNPVGLVNDLLGSISASQAATASKPTLRRGIVNLLTYSGTLGTGWSSYGGSFASGAADPNGGTTASRITSSQPVGGYYSPVVPVTAGVPVTSVGVMKAVSGGANLTFSCLGQAAFGGTGGDRVIVFNGTTGAFVSKSAEVSSYSITPLGNGFWMVLGNLTPTSAGTAPCAYYSATSGQVFDVWTAGIFTVTLTAAQILACGGIPLTTSAAASSSAGNWGWDGNGTNQYLTFTPNAITTAATLVWSGVVTSIASQSVLLGQGTGGIQLYVNTNGSIGLGIVGGASFTTPISVVTPGAPIVISASVSIGGTSSIRINGVTQATSTALAAALTGALMGVLGRSDGTLNSPAVCQGFSVENLVISSADLFAVERMIGALTGPTGVTF